MAHGAQIRRVRAQVAALARQANGPGRVRVGVARDVGGQLQADQDLQQARVQVSAARHPQAEAEGGGAAAERAPHPDLDQSGPQAAPLQVDGCHLGRR